MANPTDRIASLDPARQAASLLEEFKAFAFKGNVIDLAIGVIIGGAFGKIVDSLVKNLIMPLISTLLPGDKGYLGWSFTLRGVDVPFGLFLGEVVNFLVVALALFIFIKKFLGWVLRSKLEQPPKLTTDQQLLTEIRDLLKRS